MGESDEVLEILTTMILEHLKLVSIEEARSHESNE